MANTDMVYFLSRKQLRDQMYIGAGLAFGVVLLMLIAAVVTARILGRKVVIGSMATVLTNLILLGSIAIVAFGLFLIVEKEITGNLTEIGMSCLPSPLP